VGNLMIAGVSVEIRTELLSAYESVAFQLFQPVAIAVNITARNKRV
jgi:hypothetical protein